jgi:hypothetical protein
LTPWGERRAVVYYVDGDAVMDGPALPAKK